MLQSIALGVVIAGAVWSIDRLPPVRWLWTRFIAVTDKRPFWASVYPEMRLAGVAFFFLCFPGVVLAFGGDYFGKYLAGEIIAAVGAALVVLGVALGFYAITLGWLRFFGLRRNPEMLSNGN